MTIEENIEYLTAANILIQQQIGILTELIKLVDSRLDRLEKASKINVICSMN